MWVSFVSHVDCGRVLAGGCLTYDTEFVLFLAVLENFVLAFELRSVGVVKKKKTTNGVMQH